MKKQLISVAIASAATLPMSAFADGPIDGSVYGKINVSVVSADQGSTDQWNINSNSSRIGFKGKTELSTDLYAIYKAEFEVCADDGDCKGQTFQQRNIIVGLQGNFGSVFAGRHDTPAKSAQNKIDVFNDLEGDLKNTFDGDNRVSNVIVYSTPDMNGFNATVAFVPAEGADFDGDGSADDGLTDGMSYSLSYTMDNLYLAVAGDKDVGGQDLTRLIAQYNMDALQLGLMYQENEDNITGNIKDESGYLLSVAYKIDKTTLKAQYGTMENDANGNEEDTMSVGADYKLGKNTKTYVFYTQEEDTTSGVSVDKKYFGVGMDHNF